MRPLALLSLLLLAACGADGVPERPATGLAISATAAPGIAHDDG